MGKTFPLFISMASCWLTSISQTSVDHRNNVALNLYLNCGSCYDEFVKTEIKFVNYVRDRHDADVDLLITDQTTGSGGTEFDLFFIGLNKFRQIDDTLKYISMAGQTEDETRNELVQLIKIGLMRYVAHTPYALQIQIAGGETDQDETAFNAGDDKWKSWVFNLNGNAELSGEKSSLSQNYSGNISANKTTEKIKIDAGVSRSYGSSRFTFDDNILRSYTKSQSAYGQVVKSIHPHWSAGIFGSTGNTTYNNQNFYATVSPALEYDVFPYSRSQRKLFTIAWYLAVKHFEYSDTTIYEKINETLFQNRLSLSLAVTQPWGSVSISVFGSHYLNDVLKNHLSFYGSTDLRIFKGLSLNLFIGYELVHDQLSLPKGGASETEVLLHRKEISTSYFLNFNTGLSYRFGSKYNNVVNPRLNGGG